jgi:hypothetical protein
MASGRARLQICLEKGTASQAAEEVTFAGRKEGHDFQRLRKESDFGWRNALACDKKPYFH